MKHLDEYRDEKLARALVERLRRTATKPWVLMEVCGGQTHTLVRYGIDGLLPAGMEMIHGPGCPVCVTPLETIDKAIALAQTKGVILASYGDMLRVPGSTTDLLRVKAQGGDVRMVYSPLDALRLARENPAREVVFFGIGFETTAPPNAAAVWQAARQGVTNFSLLASHVLVPPALRALLGAKGNRVQGLIAPGHVCVVVGLDEYHAIARDFNLPIVVGGFEPVDLLEAIAMLADQLEEGRAEVENQYTRSVRMEGNRPAQKMLADVSVNATPCSSKRPCLAPCTFCRVCFLATLRWDCASATCVIAREASIPACCSTPHGMRWWCSGSCTPAGLPPK